MVCSAAGATNKRGLPGRMRWFECPCTRPGSRNEALIRRRCSPNGLPSPYNCLTRAYCLVRKRPQLNKHLLTERERLEAVRGAFATRAGSRIDKKRVLLVDDVMTTGATLDACAKVLHDAGTAEVYGLTVARAVLRNPRRVNV